MRSGRCSKCADDKRGPEHGRCHKADCSCGWHDQDIRDKAAALVEDAPLPTGAVRLRVANLNAAAALVAEADLSLDPEDSLRILHALRKATAILADVDAALVQRIYLAGEHGDVRVEGLPAARVQRGRERKSWDTRGAVLDYLGARLADVVDIEPGHATRVANMILDVAGVSYCKVTALRDVGLSIDDYCESQPGKISVQFIE